jgi:hypothetical protein
MFADDPVFAATTLTNLRICNSLAPRLAWCGITVRLSKSAKLSYKEGNLAPPKAIEVTLTVLISVIDRVAMM